MYNCVFTLNEKPMSTLRVGALEVPAFSGMKQHVNRPSSSCMPNLGPIPPGSYFILDRKEGGIMAPLRELFAGDQSRWFALYRVDARVDDEVFCDSVRRGEFRLHPKGTLGISRGCITINAMSDFMFVEQLLRGTSRITVPGTEEQAYGVVAVTW
jgi:hypothetical protein